MAAPSEFPCILLGGGCPLLPFQLLPLQLFEPRYRLMGEAALAGDRRFAVGEAVPDADGEEASAAWATLGRIVEHQMTKDGRHLLVIEGETRLKVSGLAPDPVDVLFGVQLGGGTDINRALAYCQGRITQPADTVLVLISDLYEGGIAEEMISRASAVVGSGATMIALLALSDSGQPSFDADHAAALAEIGVPSFACTPDLFPDLMAAAIEKRDITAWAAAHDIVTTHEAEPPT